MRKLTHLDEQGNAHMVDVADKAITHREATAEALLKMQPETLALIGSGGHRKGDVLAVARIAGIQAAKKCADLIPLCHPLMLTSIKVEFELLQDSNQLRITASCGLDGKTGVEMEALTAASVAAVDRGMVIESTRLLEKAGGKSGDWKANP